MCVNCNELYPKYEELETKTIESIESLTTNESGKCCGKTSKVLELLVEKEVAEQYNGNHGLLLPELMGSKEGECNTSNKTVAKLLGVHKTIIHHSDNHKLIWKRNVFDEHRIMYLKQAGEILIQRHGYYFLSSQITMKATTSSQTNENEQFGHIVYRISHQRREETVLLESWKTPCKRYEPCLEYTSSLGAVFELDENDRIFVTTSHPDLVILENDLDFFNVHYSCSSVK